MLKIYLDNCCYNRPFDDLSQEKINKEKLGVEGMIKFIQMYSDGKGNYTEERKTALKDLNKEDLQKFLREELN